MTQLREWFFDEAVQKNVALYTWAGIAIGGVILLVVTLIRNPAVPFFTILYWVFLGLGAAMAFIIAGIGLLAFARGTWLLVRDWRRR